MKKPQIKIYIKLFILAIGFSLTIVKTSLAQSILSDFGWKLSSGMLDSSEPVAMLIVGFSLLFAASIGRDMYFNPKSERK